MATSPLARGRRLALLLWAGLSLSGCGAAPSQPPGDDWRYDVTLDPSADALNVRACFRDTDAPLIPGVPEGRALVTRFSVDDGCVDYTLALGGLIEASEPGRANAALAPDALI